VYGCAGDAKISVTGALARTTWPAYMTCPVAELRTDAKVVRDENEDTRIVLEATQYPQDLSLNGDVQRGGRLTAMSSWGQRARVRSSRAGRCHPRISCGYESARGRGSECRLGRAFRRRARPPPGGSAPRGSGSPR